MKTQAWQALLAFAVFVFAQTAHSAEQSLPLWEFGIGGGAFSLPQYMGSDERYTFPFAFPYIVYRGERWRIDRSSVRNRLFDSDRLSLDLSFSLGLPVRNSNRARQGMPKLHLTGQIGPQLNVSITKANDHALSLRLPWRAAFNIRGKQVGWVAEPHLRYVYTTPMNEGMFRTRLDLGVMYASQRFNDTYYSVDPAFVRTDRPLYQASQGLHSIFARLNVRYPLNKDVQLFSSLQLRDLGIGVVRDSPLVRDRLYTSAAIGVIWIITTSDKTVTSDD